MHQPFKGFFLKWNFVKFSSVLFWNFSLFCFFYTIFYYAWLVYKQIHILLLTFYWPVTVNEQISLIPLKNRAGFFKPYSKLSQGEFDHSIFCIWNRFCFLKILHGRASKLAPGGVQTEFSHICGKGSRILICHFARTCCDSLHLLPSHFMTKTNCHIDNLKP